MTDPNRELIDDFIHSRKFFSQQSIDNYVHPDHLRAARYHHDAGRKFLEFAEKEQSKTESERLKQKARYHFHEAELILRKYGY